MTNGSCHCRAVSWQFTGKPESTTACSCTVCRRYGALWAYGYLGEGIQILGETKEYRRADSGTISFCFCPNCGCLTHYLGTVKDSEGRLRMAVNLRMAELDTVADIPVRHFDGLDTWTSVDGAASEVRDLWF